LVRREQQHHQPQRDEQPARTTSDKPDKPIDRHSPQLPSGRADNPAIALDILDAAPGMGSHRLIDVRHWTASNQDRPESFVGRFDAARSREAVKLCLPTSHRFHRRERRMDPPTPTLWQSFTDCKVRHARSFIGWQKR